MWSTVSLGLSHLSWVESSSTHSQVHLVIEHELMKKQRAREKRRVRGSSSNSNTIFQCWLILTKRKDRHVWIIDEERLSLSLLLLSDRCFTSFNVFSRILLFNETILLLMILMLINWQYLLTTGPTRIEEIRIHSVRDSSFNWPDGGKKKKKGEAEKEKSHSYTRNQDIYRQLIVHTDLFTKNSHWTNTREIDGHSEAKRKIYWQFLLIY